MQHNYVNMQHIYVNMHHNHYKLKFSFINWIQKVIYVTVHVYQIELEI